MWSANRNRPVRLNASLELTEDGNLILEDGDGTFVWSTNTTHNSVSALNLTENGNLVLLDRHNEIVWQSFDHATDSLVLQQKLIRGKKLISRVSASNSSQGLYSLSFTIDRIAAAEVESNPPQIYYFWGEGSDYIKYENGSFFGDKYDHELGEFTGSLFRTIPKAFSAQYIRMDYDGHLRVYQWLESGWQEADDLMSIFLTECQYPLVCGKYGICSAGMCTCPGASANGTINFRAINERQPNLGCSAITPISCQLSQNYSFLELQNTSYFTFQVDIRSTHVEICKQTCLKNCSCKAALFRYSCYLKSLHSRTWKVMVPVSLFLKVDNSPLGKNVEEGGNVVGKKAGSVRIM